MTGTLCLREDGKLTLRYEEALRVADTLRSREETNKKVVRDFFQAYETQDIAMIESLVKSDSIYHFANGPESDHVFAKRAERFFETFTNISIKAEDQVASGDMVVSRARFSLTHSGTYLGIPATGRKITSTFIQMDRVVNGKIVEQWFEYDLKSMLDQLGVTLSHETKR